MTDLVMNDENTESGHDLAPFRALNARGAPAEERRRVIAQAFPSTTNLNWKDAFDKDADLLGRILRDVLKVDQAMPGRPGPRPGLDQSRAEPVLDRMMGKDPADRPYSLLPFPEAFRVLLGGRSLRATQRKLAIDRDRIHRLLHGVLEPRAEEMEHIAEVYGKSPSYFLEYRIRSIATAVQDALEVKPEQSIQVYERIWMAAS